MTLLLLLRPLGGAGGLELTDHARGQMRERGVRPCDVVTALSEAEHIERDERRVVVRGATGLEVVLDVAMVAVLTVRPPTGGPRRWRPKRGEVSSEYRGASVRRSRGRRLAGQAAAVLRAVP